MVDSVCATKLKHKLSGQEITQATCKFAKSNMAIGQTLHTEAQTATQQALEDWQMKEVWQLTLPMSFICTSNPPRHMTPLINACLSNWPYTNLSIIPFSLTLINTLCLPASHLLSHPPIHPSIHQAHWLAQVITHCDDGFVTLISLIITVSYNLVLCRDPVILLWHCLTLATECEHVWYLCGYNWPQLCTALTQSLFLLYFSFYFYF